MDDDGDLLEGRVVVFDEHRGLGEVEGSGGARYPFHCVEITDGTRHVDVGAPVTFTVVPGLLGRWEAATIHKA